MRRQQWFHHAPDDPDMVAIGKALLLANAREIDCAIQLEWLASRFLPCWSDQPIRIDIDYVEETCSAIVADLESEGDSTALVVLRGLAAVGSGRFAREGGSAADRLAASGVTTPPWAWQIGTAQAVDARVMRNDTDESKGVLIEYAYPDDTRHAISAFVAADLGGAAKFLGLTRAFAEFPDGGDELEPLAVHEASATMRDALAVTDQAHARRAGDPSLSDLGPLAWSRVRAVKTGVGDTPSG